ncbi:MAG TPA: Xaa-Pro peptidase family protein [Thermodesulfobacteriota bacterium]|nr:Xaa-Pro peptidase family protein [Thermodesulfobacteriota bacterium]
MAIPNSVLQERIRDVEAKLTAEGLKALVVYSTGSSLGSASRTHGYLRYLLDWDSRNGFSALVLTPGEKPILFVSNPAHLRFAREIFWFPDIRLVSAEGLGRGLVSVLRPRLSAGDRAGFIGRVETPVVVYEPLTKELPGVTIVPANALLDALRLVKDPLAISLHRHAAEISDEMFQTFTREVRQGKKGYQLQADVEHTAKYAGCEHASTFLAVAPVVDRARYYKRENSRVPQEGDQVLLAVFLTYEGHWGHAIRVGTLGEPNAAQRRAFNIALEMEEAALGILKPGIDANELWKASAKVLARYYPDGGDPSWFWLRSGHGIGLDYSDPVLTEIFRFPYELGKEKEARGPSLPLQPGMLLELHPNVFLPNEAVGAIGDMVLVTETGYEILNRFPRELIRW